MLVHCRLQYIFFHGLSTIGHARAVCIWGYFFLTPGDDKAIWPDGQTVDR
jgi:hypothetical protein